MATLAIRIDPSSAVDAARIIKRSLEDVQAAAERVERSTDSTQSAFGRFATGAKGARDATEGFARGAGTANDNLARLRSHVDSAALGFQRLMSVLTPLAGILGARQLGLLADEWSELQARVSNAVGDMGDAEQVLGRISDMARRTYSSLGQTAEAWLSNATSLTAMGVALDKQLDLVESLNNSLVISATRGDRAASVQRAWSNAMALGALRGNDLNAVLTGSDRLAQALADSMGVNINELRKMGAEGLITRDKMLGLTDQLETLRQEAEAMPATLADGLTLIGNALLETVGVLDQAGGLSEGLAEKLVAVADNLDVALTAMAAAALLAAARIGGPLVAAYVSATGAIVAKTTAQASLALAMARASTGTAAQTAAFIATTAAARAASAAVSGLSLALAAVGGPAGAAILALGGVMYTVAQQAWEAQQRSDRYAEAIRIAGENSGGAAGGIREAARALQEVETAATSAERAVSRAIAQADFDRLMRTLSGNIVRLGIEFGSAADDIVRDIDAMMGKFQDGELSAEDFIFKVDEISTVNPDASPIIAEIQRIIREAAAALGVLDALNTAAAGIGQIAGGKESRLGNDPLSDFDFDQRWNAGWGDIGERLASSNTAMERAAKKAGGGSGDRKKKGGSDRANEYEQLTQRIRENIDAMLVEAETIAMTDGEAAKYMATQDLLRAAMEAKLPVTDALKQQINQLATEFSNAKMFAEGARLELELANDPLTILQQEMQRLDELLAAGAIGWDAYGDAALRANAGAAAAVLGLAGQMSGALASMFKENKAFALANAIISTAAAIAKTIEAYGYTPWGIAAAAAAAAQGAAQIATIRSTSKGGGASVRSAGGSGAVSQPRQEQAITRQQAVSITLQGDYHPTANVEKLVDELLKMQADGFQIVLNRG